jgi:hypothetical protein
LIFLEILLCGIDQASNMLQYQGVEDVIPSIRRPTMKRTLILTTAVLIGWLGCVSLSHAQVFIRAPFVRVGVGDGVYVRAPFVNLYVPPAGGVVYGPYGPPPAYIVPQQPLPATEQLPAPQPVPVPQPLPQVKDANAPPQPVVATQVTSMEAFAKNFQPKAGSYEVTMLNPLTNKPATVRFTLPEGTPRRVIVGRDHVEFFYGLRHFVRIEFDRDGPTVIAR